MTGIEQVNERSTRVFPISFTDGNGDAVIPNAASYRIDDVGSGAAVRDDTELQLTSPATTSADIVLGPSDTSILDETKAYETRRITVSWTYGDDSPPAQETAEYFLNVVNLRGVTTP